MMKSIFCAGAFAFAASAAPGVLQAPIAGIVREADNTLRPIYGFSANLIGGVPWPTENIRACSFSDTAGLIAIPGEIRLVRIDGGTIASSFTEEAHPILSIGDGPESAIAWLPGEGKLLHWSNGRFIVIPLDVAALSGSIVSLQMNTPDSVDLWVDAQNSILQHARVSLGDSHIEYLERIPSAGPALAAGRALVFQDERGLEIRDATGGQTTVAAPAANLSIERASTNWVHISAIGTSRQWMLHVRGNTATLSEIPIAAGDAK